VSEVDRARIITETIDTLRAVEFDLLSQTEEVRVTAERLNLPYIVVRQAADMMTAAESRFITNADLREYIDWCARNGVDPRAGLTETEV
jgi:hypothetical protein